MLQIIVCDKYWPPPSCLTLLAVNRPPDFQLSSPTGAKISVITIGLNIPLLTPMLWNPLLVANMWRSFQVGGFTHRHVFTLSGCCTPFLPVPLGSMYSLWRVFGSTGHWGTLVGMWTDRRGGSPQFIGKDESLTSGKGSYSTHKHSYGTVFHLSSTELDNTVAATATEHDALSNKDPLINKDFNLKFSDYSILHVAITPCRHVHSKQG